jgi:hypothetical protein
MMASSIRKVTKKKDNVEIDIQEISRQTSARNQAIAE